MMKKTATVVFTEKFVIDGVSYVKIQAVLPLLGCLQFTVKESLVPDALEGHQVELSWDIGIDKQKMKPYLRFTGLKVVDNQ